MSERVCVECGAAIAQGSDMCVDATPGALRFVHVDSSECVVALQAALERAEELNAQHVLNRIEIEGQLADLRRERDEAIEALRPLAESYDHLKMSTWDEGGCELVPRSIFRRAAAIVAKGKGMSERCPRCSSDDKGVMRDGCRVSAGEATHQWHTPTAPDPVGEARCNDCGGAVGDDRVTVRGFDGVLRDFHGEKRQCYRYFKGQLAALRAENERLREGSNAYRLGYEHGQKAGAEIHRIKADRYRTALERARELSYASRWADLICALEAALTDQA